MENRGDDFRSLKRLSNERPNRENVPNKIKDDDESIIFSAEELAKQSLEHCWRNTFLPM